MVIIKERYNNNTKYPYKAINMLLWIKFAYIVYISNNPYGHKQSCLTNGTLRFLTQGLFLKAGTHPPTTRDIRHGWYMFYIVL